MTDPRNDPPSVGGRAASLPDHRPEEGFDELLERLEGQIARLADGSAPLDQTVEAHEEAQKLIDEAQRRLRALLARVRAEQGESP